MNEMTRRMKFTLWILSLALALTGCARKARDFGPPASAQAQANAPTCPCATKGPSSNSASNSENKPAGQQGSVDGRPFESESSADNAIEGTPSSSKGTATVPPATTASDDSVPGLNSISLQFLGQSYADYRVNQYLNLTVAHQFRAQLEPKFPAGFPLPANVRARIALALDSADAIEKTSSGALVAWAQIEGRISANEPLLINDLVLRYPRIGQSMIRNRVLVELDWGTGRRAFWGKLSGLPEGGDSRLIPVKLDLSALIAQAEAARAAKKDAEKPHDLFLKSHELTILDLSKAAPAEGVSALFADSASTRQAALKSLCKIAYPDEKEGRRGIFSRGSDPGFPVGPGRKRGQSHQDYCLAQPDSSLKAKLQDFIDGADAIVDAAPTLVGSPESLSHSVSAGWSFSRSAGESTSTSTSVSQGISSSTSASFSLGKILPVDFGQSFSYSSGTSWSWSKSQSVGTSSGASVSTSTGTSLVSEKAQFRFRARTLRCVTVEAAQNLAFKALHLCEASPQERDVTETYYLVRQPQATAMLFDSRADGASARFLIRGEARFAQFLAAVSNPAIQLSTAAGSSANLEELLNPELPSLADNAFPGAVDINQ